MEAAPHLRPMSIGDLLDASFKLYRKHFLTFIGIVAVVQVPFALLQFLAQYGLGRGAMADLQNMTSGASSLPPGASPFAIIPFQSLGLWYGVIALLSLLQGLFLYNLLMGALSTAVSRSYFGQAVDILSSYRFGWRRLLSLIGVSLIYVLVSLVAFSVVIGIPLGMAFWSYFNSQPDAPATSTVIIIFLCVFSLFGIAALLFGYVAIRLAVVPQAVVLENLGAFASIRRSWQLVKGSFWRVLGTTFLMGILVYLVTALVSSPGVAFNAFIQLRSTDMNMIVLAQSISTLLSQIGLIIALPLQMIVLTLLYYDLCVRKEGLDMQLQVEQWAAS